MVMVENVQEGRGRPKDISKRQDIMDAAGELFRAGGFHGTSMDALAQAAGVSKATLYSHFADKQSLYRALIEAKMADYQVDDFAERVCGDMAADLAMIARQMLDLVYDDEALDMLRMVIAEGREGSDVPSMFEEVGPRRLMGQISDYLAMQKQKGVPYISDAVEDANLLGSLVIEHRTMMFCLMGVETPPDATVRKAHAEKAVARFIMLKQSETTLS
jgi:TetR/AcrR family transcriptional repressor of mexJK operon